MNTYVNNYIDNNNQSNFYSKVLKNRNKINKTAELNNYQIKQTIGNGTYGKVKRAKHLATGETVAVKVISKPKLSNDELAKIYTQINIQKQLIHQNIIRIYEVIQSLEKIYIFMEYCPNGDIFEYMSKNGPFSQNQAARIFKQVFQALKYLHQVGICHRDIKCQNIVFDRNNNCKLIDFGFAKKYNSGDRLQTACGSILYSCPQIAMGMTYIPQKADIWSMGIFLYTMVSGEFPFETRDMVKAKYNIISCAYKPQKGFSLPLQQIISQMLSEAQNRSSFSALEQSQFYRSYHSNYIANFVNPITQEEIFDEKIIQVVSLQHKIPIQDIIKSLTEKKLDSNSSLYYLSLVMHSYNGQMSNLDINSQNYVKRTKQSKKRIKLIDRNHTLSKSKQGSKEKKSERHKDNLSFIIKHRMATNEIKIKRSSSPQLKEGNKNFQQIYHRKRFISHRK